MTVDAEIYIDSLDNVSDFSLAYDDNSGGGPFGTNSRLIFTGEDFGSFLVIVSDLSRSGPGAYMLTVEYLLALRIRIPRLQERGDSFAQIV